MRASDEKVILSQIINRYLYKRIRKYIWSINIHNEVLNDSIVIYKLRICLLWFKQIIPGIFRYFQKHGKVGLLTWTYLRRSCVRPLDPLAIEGLVTKKKLLSIYSDESCLPGCK